VCRLDAIASAGGECDYPTIVHNKVPAASQLVTWADGPNIRIIQDQPPQLFADVIFAECTGRGPWQNEIQRIPSSPEWGGLEMLRVPPASILISPAITEAVEGVIPADQPRNRGKAHALDHDPIVNRAPGYAPQYSLARYGHGIELVPLNGRWLRLLVSCRGSRTVALHSSHGSFDS
jgi:hypothetical protein